MKTSALYSEPNEIIIYSIIARVNNRWDTLDNTNYHYGWSISHQYTYIHVNTHILAL